MLVIILCEEKSKNWSNDPKVGCYLPSTNLIELIKKTFLRARKSIKMNLSEMSLWTCNL